jgi:lipopolysaccharide/colanic/teichoic acid biosynthesis glycosyltransferase
LANGQEQSKSAPRSRFNPHRSVSGLSGSAKRLVDIVFSAVALIVLLPLLVLITVAVGLTSGRPVLYRQTRVTLRGRRFNIIKFRTMQDGAERDLGAIWCVPDDPRCTRLGHVLRRFGLDELPQLWNILRGEMSLVGPRPERPEFVKEFRKDHPGYDLRHVVRCGLTGYAQIHGWRGYTSIDERLRHDLHYVQTWSLLLDIKILGLTLLHGWSERTRNGVEPFR